MSAEPEIFPLGFIGNEFKGKLINYDDPQTPVTQDLTQAEKIYIIFYKPDGTQIPSQANLEAESASNAVLEDVGQPQDTYIVYKNIATSILDQRGYWEFTPGARFENDNLIISPFRTGFWVV